ncbi:MAG: stage III sporulation protein AF [Defluviitaleaceae bacterium]|nr:stage III sporulation protein AF [Defluviitaleaceae bacterium]
MPAFFTYLQNITYYLVFATVIGIFAPSGKYKKFVSLVLGFVLLLLMIQPLAGFFNGRDVPVTQWFAGFSGDGGIARAGVDSAYADWWDGHLRVAFEAQLDAQISRLLEGEGFEVYSTAFTYTDDFGELNSIRVSVSRREKTDDDTGRIPFIRIQTPQVRIIQIGEPASDKNCPDSALIKNLISDFYNLPTSHIYVTVQ